MKYKFLVWWLAGILSTVLALPYVFALQHDVIAKSATPLYIVGLLAVVQTAILLAATVFLGLKLSRSVNLPASILFDSKIRAKENLKRILKTAVPIGVAVGLAIKIGDLFFAGYIPQIVTAAERIPFWKNLLVAPYGGVVEELLMRLFCVSLFAWLLAKITGTKEVAKNNWIMWVSIMAAAILFGLGHLPVTATIIELTPVVVARAVLLNGVGGLVFGWLYWKKGLEYGVAAHFVTDIVLIAVIPALLK